MASLYDTNGLGNDLDVALHEPVCVGDEKRLGWGLRPAQNTDGRLEKRQLKPTETIGTKEA